MQLSEGDKGLVAWDAPTLGVLGAPPSTAKENKDTWQRVREKIEKWGRM